MIQKLSKITILLLSAGWLAMASSCNDFLDREPLDQITPDIYFANEGDLAAYTLGCYGFSTYDPGSFSIGTIANDNNTDNQANSGGSTALWVPGEKRVAASGGAWDFAAIRKANYFFERVLPKYEEGSIAGNEDNIRHYIGEMYFLRAYNYYSKLVNLGDFPIVTETLPDEQEVLIEASKRRPRNEVTRFILEDLDKAASMMLETSPNGKNRLSRKVALLFKSRVALFEGTWLKYHKGTNRVPGGPGWPGAEMDYNSDFSIDIDSEINFFLTEAQKAAAEVADAVTLTESTETVNPVDGEPYGWNPYFDMFCATDMDPIDEVLMWRDYDLALGVGHSAGVYLSKGGGNMGYTRSMVDAFLMRNGLPIYASNSGYQGDLTLERVKQDRDLRLQLFVAAPTDTLLLATSTRAGAAFEAPLILNPEAERCPTGYAPRKCMTYDPAQITGLGGKSCDYGCIIFRGVEAYLNYIEATYELTGKLDAKATNYWKAIRRRAGVSDNLDATINATDLSQESDWAKYSGETLVSPTLFNIRRERRVELMSESFRMNDLKRWRALDKVQNYQVEGFNLWGGEIEKMYEGELIPTGTSGKQPNVSSEELSGSTYLRIYQIVDKNNLLWDGYTWCPANYLEPIAAIHFTLTASNIDDPDTSVIYQNPGWPKIANESAIGY